MTCSNHTTDKLRRLGNFAPINATVTGGKFSGKAKISFVPGAHAKVSRTFSGDKVTGSIHESGVPSSGSKCSSPKLTYTATK